MRWVEGKWFGPGAGWQGGWPLLGSRHSSQREREREAERLGGRAGWAPWQGPAPPAAPLRAISSIPWLHSPLGPVVWDCPVEGDAVAELGIVAVLLIPALGLLAVITQGGRHAPLAQATRPLHQADGLGEACRDRQGWSVGAQQVPRGPGDLQRGQRLAGAGRGVGRGTGSRPGPCSP